MKLTTILFGLIFTGSVLATSVNTVVPINNVFSPNGFDTNDNVEIILSGYLPNTCYQVPSSKIEIKGRSIFIKMTAKYFNNKKNLCAEMIIPFQEIVDLGTLEPGKYNIYVNNKTIYSQKAHITIANSHSSAVDDFVYANVEYVEKKLGSRVVHLKGYNPSDCFELKEVKLVNNGKDTFSILPKMVQVSSFCPMKMVPFDYEVKIPKVLKSDQVLLHVRILDGRSVNTLFQNNL